MARLRTPPPRLSQSLVMQHFQLTGPRSLNSNVHCVLTCLHVSGRFCWTTSRSGAAACPCPRRTLWGRWWPAARWPTPSPASTASSPQHTQAWARAGGTTSPAPPPPPTSTSITPAPSLRCPALLRQDPAPPPPQLPATVISPEPASLQPQPLNPDHKSTQRSWKDRLGLSSKLLSSIVSKTIWLELNVPK